jgi:hypothetical protein
MVKRLRLSKT